MNPGEYLAELQARLVTSTAINTVTIIDERTLADSGYFRARLRLSNGDFLEVAEYFVFDGDACHPYAYRYQWMNDTQTQLRRRWDNVAHFPDSPMPPSRPHR